MERAPPALEAANATANASFPEDAEKAAATAADPSLPPRPAACAAV